MTNTTRREFVVCSAVTAAGIGSAAVAPAAQEAPAFGSPLSQAKPSFKDLIRQSAVSQGAIDANVTATVHLPARPDSRIEESGKEISRHSDLQVVSRLGGEAVIEVGSGVYHFSVKS